LVRAYQCDTFWQDSEPQKKNNVVSPAGSYEPIVASKWPTKRRTVSSPAVSPFVYQATPSPVKKRASAPAAKEQESILPVTDSHEPLQGFCNDLQAGLKKISSDDLAEAAKEKRH
jgi:hypothetical protein